MSSSQTNDVTAPVDLKYRQSFWYANWSFPIIVAILSSGVFAGTHMYYVHKVGAFNEIAMIALLEAGLQGGGYGAAAAFGISLLLARMLEGAMIGVLDIGGPILTGVGIGMPALLLASGVTLPMESFLVSLGTGLFIGLCIGYAVLLIKRLTADKAPSAFGSDVIIGAGNSAIRLLGPLLILSAASYSIPVGIGSILGGALFYAWNKPVAAGALVGALVVATISTM